MLSTQGLAITDDKNVIIRAGGTILFLGGGALVVVAIVPRQSSLADEHLFQRFVIFAKSHYFQSGYDGGKQDPHSNRDREIINYRAVHSYGIPLLQKMFLGKNTFCLHCMGNS